MTQRQLAMRASTTQNAVSLLEAGEVIHSAVLPRICKILKIAPPGEFSSEEQRRWSELGHKLEGRSAEQFRRAMALVESMLGMEDADAPIVEKKPRGTARATRRAAVAVSEPAPRAGDETSVEVALRKKQGG